MSAGAAALRGRAAAEALMVDTFTPYAPNGSTTGGDGLQVPAYTTKTATVGKTQSRSMQSEVGHRMVRVGDVERPVLEAGLHIPMTALVPVAGDQGVGWEYVCTAVGVGSDPALVGRRWLVVSVASKTFQTSRRLDVVEVTSP